jgi:hypothetical protein
MLLFATGVVAISVQLDEENKRREIQKYVRKQIIKEMEREEQSPKLK